MNPLYLLNWSRHTSPKDVPYSEADLTEFFREQLGGRIEDRDTFEVTLRRYPKNYHLAFVYESGDADFHYVGETYTHDGEGCGVIPFSVAILKVYPVPHAEFEADFMAMFEHLKRHIGAAISRGYS